MDYKESTAILIPAYKPGNELLEVCEHLEADGYPNIVVVDDGGGSEYRHIFESLPRDVTVLVHEVNRGKGRALKTGMEHIYNNMKQCTGIVTCDADGQHRPCDIDAVAKRLSEENSDALVLGSRKFDKDVPLRSQIGNTVTRWIYSLASHVKVRDTQTGLRAFSSSLVPFYMSLEGERYEFEINMLLYTAKRHSPIIEVDIETVYLDADNSSSHFRVFRDSAIIYGKILKYSAASIICFLIDFVALFVFKWILGFSAFSAIESAVRLLIAVIAARIISSAVNYILNRRLVFGNGDKTSVVKYYILAVCILGANYGLLWLLTECLTFPLFWAKLIVEVLLYFVSFNVQKYLIFNKKS